MIPNWRFKLREAQEALKAGRLTDACQLVRHHQLDEFLPGKRLLDQLVPRLANRLGQRVRQGCWAEAAEDMAWLVLLGGDSEAVERARLELDAAAEQWVKERLLVGDDAGALERLEELADSKVALRRIAWLREAARGLKAARQCARRGRFEEARRAVAVVIQRGLTSESLASLVADYETKARQSRELAEGLHGAMGESRWQDAVALADQLLALAPESPVARQARRKAWAKVGTCIDEASRIGQTMSWCSSGGASDSESLEPLDLCGQRLLLWVDGVGGYLVCLSSEVVIGQAVPGNDIHIPLVADLSRRHGRIVRDDEAYLIEPLQETRLNGRRIHSKALLVDGAEIEFGPVRMRFRQPHALSGSARLELLSGHRSQPFADGILLMAESCVLGPSYHNHVVCREWQKEVVLFRRDGHLYCRAGEPIEIEGVVFSGRGRLEGNCHVVGTDFSLSVEELDKCSQQPLR